MKSKEKYKILDPSRVVMKENPTDLEVVKCGICKNILWDGILCSECFIRFCRLCIESYKAKHYGKCMCGSTFREIGLSKKIQECLTGMRLVCKNAKNGCSELIAYGQVPKHEESCGYELVPCPNKGCDINSLKRMEMDEHRAGCNYEKLSCPNCNLPLLRKELGAHNMECPEILIGCEDCKEPIKKKLMLEHRNVCLKKRIVCGNCSMEATKEEIDKHDCVTHLKDVIKSLIESNEKLKAKVHNQNKEIENLTKKIKKKYKPECGKCGKPTSHKIERECRKCKRFFCHSCIAYCFNCHNLLCKEHSRDHCSVLYTFSPLGLHLYDMKAKKGFFKKDILKTDIDIQIGTALILNKIYYAGGRVDQEKPLAQAGCIEYDSNLNTIVIELANMNAPKFNNALVAINCSSLISIGGSKGGDPVAQCEFYNIEKNNWKKIKNMNCARSRTTAFNLNHEKIFVFGSITQCKHQMECMNITNPRKEWVWIPIKLIDRSNWSIIGKELISAPINAHEILLVSKIKRTSVIYNSLTSEISDETIIDKGIDTFHLSLAVVFPKLYLYDNTFSQIRSYSITDKKWVLEPGY